MKAIVIPAAVGLALVTSLAAGPASAAGCIKGALVGGLAGHFVHHGLLGAAAGCAIGHHEASKQTMQRNAETDRGTYRSMNGGYDTQRQ